MQRLLREWTDAVHLVIGVSTGIASKYMPMLSIAIAIIFIAYQEHEEEDMLCKMGDYIEFLLGFAIGSAIPMLPIP